MRRLVAAALTALAVLTLAPPAHASESRLLVVPLTFEEGGDGTGYATFEIPAGETWTLTRVLAVHRDGIDTVNAYDSATSAPTGSERTYYVEVGGSTRWVDRPDLTFGGQFLNFIVSTVTNTATPTGGFVRIRVTVN